MSFELRQVPDVRGLSTVVALSKLTAAGFDVAHVRREPCPARDTVTRQYLGELPRGTALNLIVSEGPSVHAEALDRLAKLIGSYQAGPKLDPLSFISELQAQIAVELGIAAESGR